MSSSPIAVTTSLTLFACVMLFPPAHLNVAAATEIVLGQSASFSGGAWEPGPQFNKGLLAAFWEVNNQSGGVNGRRIVLHTLDDQYVVSNIAPNVAQLLAIPDMFAFVSFMGSPTTSAALPLLDAAQMPLVGPLTGSSVFRKTFNPWTINVRAGYDDEVLVMLRLFVSVLRYRRISIIYQDDAFGAPPKDQILEAMANLNLEMTGVHPYTRSEIPNYDYEAYAREVFEKRPQGIVLFCVEGFSNPFMTEMYRIMTYPVKFVTGSWIGDGNRNHLLNNNMDPTNFYQTQVVPHPTQSNLNITKQYRAAILEHYGADATYDFLGFEGYIVGRHVIEALRRTPNLTRAEFLNAIYTTKLFGIEELLAGPYSRDCVYDPGTAGGRSSLCYCNQGMRLIATTGLSSTYSYEPAADDVTYPLTECFATKDLVQRPIVLAEVARQDYATLLAPSMRSVSQGISVNTAVDTALVSILSDGGENENATATKVTSLGENTLLLGSLGFTSVPATTQYPVFSIVNPEVEIFDNEFQRNRIQIFATIQQHLHATAKFAVNNRSTSGEAIHALFSTEASAARGTGSQQTSLQGALASSLDSFDAALSGSPLLFDSGALALAELPTQGKLIVIGLKLADDVIALLDHLTSHESLSVILTFAEYGLHHEIIHPRPSPVLSRVQFTTNLPLWTDPSDVLASNFHAAMHEKGLSANISNPFIFAGYFFSRVIAVVTRRANGDASPVAFLEELYRTSVVSIDGVSLGPFVDQQCSTEDCLCNIGPHQLRVYSALQVVDPSLPASLSDHRFTSCYVEYVVRTEPGLAAWKVVLSSVLPLLAIVCFVIIFLLWRRQQKVAHAPKNTKTFFSMFVSLKNETQLWDLYGDSMGSIMNKYHRIIASTARRNRCYVAKYIGGATLVVATSSEQILACAEEVAFRLQREKGLRLALLDIENGTNARSSIGRRTKGSSYQNHGGSEDDEGSIISDRVSEARSVTSMSQRSTTQRAGNSSHPSHMSAGQAASLVAFGIGIHSDNGHIKYDEDRHSYEYSGPSIDGAAVASDKAQADQILVTNAVDISGYGDGSQFIEFCMSDWGKDTMLLQFNPANLPTRNFVAAASKDESNVDSIASRLEQQSTGMTKKKVVVACIHFQSLEAESKNLSRDAFVRLYAEKLDVIADIVQAEKGHIHSMIGSTMYISFNAAKPCPNALHRAYTALEEIRLYEKNHGFGISSGIASDLSIVGNLKIGGNSHHAVFSRVGQVAHLLQRMCQEYPEVSCLAQYELHEELSTFSLQEFIDIYQLPAIKIKSSKEGTVVDHHNSNYNAAAKGLIALRGLKEHDVNDDDEWMYALENGENASAFAPSNKIYLHILSQSTVVQEHLDKLLEAVPEANRSCLGYRQATDIVTELCAATKPISPLLSSPLADAPLDRKTPQSPQGGALSSYLAGKPRWL